MLDSAIHPFIRARSRDVAQKRLCPGCRAAPVAAVGWLGDSGVEFASSIPSIGDVEFDGDEPLLHRIPPGAGSPARASELKMLVSGSKDGGLFIMTGRTLK